MTFKTKDFVSVDFDLYANGKLVQTTSEKKAKEANLEGKDFKPVSMVLGKAFVLKALDEAIEKTDIGKENSIELTAEQAYGKRKKEMIRTFPENSFIQNKMRPVVGMTYDFNGMYGTVKSASRGRVMVDFNNPLSGKDIKIDFKVIEKIEDIKTQMETIFEAVLKFPNNMYNIEVKNKNITLAIPKELHPIKDQLTKTFEEFIFNFKDFTLELQEKEVTKEN